MTRKDSEKDADRPHYYSQFWLDIATGRRVIGGPKPEEAEASEVVEPVPARKTVGRNNTSDGYRDLRASAVVEPEEEEEDVEQEEPIDETEMPNILVDEEVDDFGAQEGEAFDDEEEEEFFDEEEEEEDDDWNRRGRKKPKPSRPVKPVSKKPKRDTRRPF